MNKQIYANIALLTVAVIWGLTFTAQRVGMEFLGPFTFNAVRAILGSISLVPVIILFKLMQKKKRKQYSPEKIKVRRLRLLQGGLACGLVLFLGMTLQQIGLIYTSAGKAGFITALYIVIVPILSFFYKHKITANVWVSVFLAAVGLYLLCCKTNMSVAPADLILIISALMFAVHIMVINHYSPKVNPIKLSCAQFFVAGILSIVPMFIFETPDIHNIWLAKDAIIYSGFFACGVAYTLQIAGQKNTSPVVASLILSLESVFAVIGGFLILHEVLSLRELIGCGFMITATILSQLNIPALKELLNSADTKSK